ncbi:hypothetical protein SCHPADRAFT_916667 [Schizopora paradoxa]|uniref:DUF1760-domain-containing protein n=1 Tax=Schizopora paradoxa TaxID=27342 RepID=A0A0H2RJ35_9AGAM|nr:hypothetical protein SCHPADRAFT_916667 [Schizopora paradoxa]
MEGKINDETHGELEDFLRSKLLEADSDADIDIGVDLTALITNAVLDSNPKYSLEGIRHCIANMGLASKLDALSAIPMLVDSIQPGAEGLLDLVGECGNAKEVTISVQEELERLKIRFSNDDDDNEQEQNEQEEKKCSSATQFIRLLNLYSQAIPRLKLRKKTATDTLKSLFGDLGLLFYAFTTETDVEEAEGVFIAFSRLVHVSKSWSEIQTINESSEINGYLLELLCDAIAPLSHHFSMGLAQSKFDAAFPRLRGNTKPANTRHTETSLKCLSCTCERISLETRPGTLQLLAYSWPTLEFSESSYQQLLSRTLPLLIDSISNGRPAVDESLFIILSSLHPNKVSPSYATQEWDSTFVMPLVNALSMLACGHPDGQIRLIAFRAVGGLLYHLPPLAHLQVLHDLLTDTDLPHMRIAAVGLLKDAVLSALASPSSNVFASPILLQTFGSVVLRPEPPDLFSQSILLEEFDEMDERKRLVECLSFYYVLLLRDVDNRTGVRDSTQLKTVERDLLKPLQSQLEKWEDGGITMSLAALTTSLERVSNAIDEIRSLTL